MQSILGSKRLPAWTLCLRPVVLRLHLTPLCPPCRAARLCHAVAHGGQIAVPLDIAQRFAEHCTGTPAAFTEDSLTSTAPPVSKSLPPASLLDMSLPGIVEAASGELHYPDGSNGSKEGAEFAAVPVRGERGSRVSRVSRLSGSQKHSGGLGLRGSEAEGLLQGGHRVLMGSG